MWRGTFIPLSDDLRMSLVRAIVEDNMKVHDEKLGFVPVEVTGIPEEEKVFFENGDFEGLVKHLQKKGELSKEGGNGKMPKKRK